MIKLIGLFFMLNVGCYADEVKIRGASENEIQTKPWLADAISDYNGLYVLREQDGPQDVVVLSYFETSEGHKFTSVMYIEKSFYNAQPIYHNLGVFKIDLKTGKFIQLYSKKKIKALKFSDVAARKINIISGLSLDGILFKKVK